MKEQRLLLREGYFLVDGAFQLCDLRITGSTISDIGTGFNAQENEKVVSLAGLHVLPGLINSHDHLEFNLYPRLGNPPYQNYVDWAQDIQRTKKCDIQKVLQVPLRYRLLWGAYKNILSGVTTVVHHNRYYWNFRFNYPLEVFRPYQWIHSLRLEKRDLTKLLSDNSTTRFIHLAEGIVALAAGELKELSTLGGLNNHTIIIHGVGLSDEDIATMAARRCGMIWCPSSNLYLFGRTAPIEKMTGVIPVALGSDSALTGSLSLFDEMRVASRAKNIDTPALIGFVTSTPSRMLRTNKGVIRRGAAADLLMYEAGNLDPFETVLALSARKIRCLWKNGHPIFGDIEFADISNSQRSLSKIDIAGTKKFIKGDFSGLCKKIRRASPSLDLPPIAD
jgi:cytosine/adenosine deaminase-related metal-dependent hydrolase